MPALGDLFSCVLRQRLHAQLINNVYHYVIGSITGTPADLDMALVAQSFGALLTPNLKSFQSAELTHEAVIVQKIRPLPAEMAGVSTFHAGPGSVGGDSLPTSVAAVCTKRTKFAGPRWRGRIYVAGVPVTSESNSQLSEGALGALSAVAFDFNDSVTYIQGLMTVRFDPVLYHRDLGTTTIIETGTAQAVLRNQRRRQVGKGA